MRNPVAPVSGISITQTAGTGLVNGTSTTRSRTSWSAASGASIGAGERSAKFGRRKVAWQLIDTAPINDREHILLFGNGDGFSECVIVGYWDDNAECWLCFNGFGFVEPTHWMPLPEAPN